MSGDNYMDYVGQDPDSPIYVMQALIAFVAETGPLLRWEFRTKNICDWANSKNQHRGHPILCNSQKVARFIREHETCPLKALRRVNNTTVYGPHYK